MSSGGKQVVVGWVDNAGWDMFEWQWHRLRVNNPESVYLYYFYPFLPNSNVRLQYQFILKTRLH